MTQSRSPLSITKKVRSTEVIKSQLPCSHVRDGRVGGGSIFAVVVLAANVKVDHTIDLHSQ